MNFKIFYKNDVLFTTIENIKQIFNNNGFIENNDDFSLAVVYGGDGTFLHTIHTILKNKIKNIKYIAINADTVGFYLSFKISNLNIILKKFKSLDILEIPIYNAKIDNIKYEFINDLSIISNYRAIKFKWSLNQKKRISFSSFSSGFLISTVFGSSAFNHSVNGPLFLTSNYSFLVLNNLYPINNMKYHSFRNSFVIDDNNTINFQLLDKRQNLVSFTIDGNIHKSISNKIEINKSSKYILLYCVNKAKFLLNNIKYKIR